MRNKEAIDDDDDILDEADYDYQGLDKQKNQQKNNMKKDQNINDEKNLRQAHDEFEFSDEEDNQHVHKKQEKFNPKQAQMQELADEHENEEEKQSEEGYEDEYEGQFEEEIEEGGEGEGEDNQNNENEGLEREQENDNYENQNQEQFKVVSEKQLESQKVKQNEKDRKTAQSESRGNTSNSVTRTGNNRGRSSESSRIPVPSKNGGNQSTSRSRIPPSGLQNAKRKASNSQTRQGMFRLLKMKDLEEMLQERDYQRASFKDIKAEHDELREKLRELNQKLNEKVENSQAILQKQAMQEQKADKKVRSTSNQLRTADAETDNNNKIIKRLTEELSKYQNRITLVADPNYNNQLKSQIEASQNLIAKFKLTSKQVGLKNDQQSKELSKLSSEESTSEGAKQALQLRVEVQSNLGKLNDLQKKINEQEDLHKRKNELLDQKEEELQKKIEEARLIGVSTDLDNRDSKKKNKIKEQKLIYLQAEKNLQTLTKMYKTKEAISGREIEDLLKQLDTFDRSIESTEEQIQQVVQTINARIQSTGDNQTEILSKLQLDAAKNNSNNNNEESTTRYSVESSASSKPNMKIFRKGSDIGSERKIPTEGNPKNDSQSNRKDMSTENGLISNSKSESADSHMTGQNNQPNQGVNFHSKNKKGEDTEQDQSVITKPFSIKKGGNPEQRVWMPETNKIEDKEPISNTKNGYDNSPKNDDSKALMRPFSIKKDETPRKPLEQNKTEIAQPNIFNAKKETESSSINNQGDNQDTGAPPRMFKFKKNSEGSSSVQQGGGYNPIESIGLGKQNEQQQQQQQQTNQNQTKESDDFDADNMVVNSRMGRGARRGKNETQHQQKLSQIEEEQSRVVLQSQQQFSDAPNDYPSAANFPSGQTTRRTNQNIEQNPMDFAHTENNKNIPAIQNNEINNEKADNIAPVVPRRRQNQENKNTFDYGAQLDGNNQKDNNISSQEPQANEKTKWTLDAAVGDDEFASLNGPSRRVRNINSNNDVNINKNMNSEKVTSSTQHENAIFQEKQTNATNQPRTFNFQKNIAPPSPQLKEETKKEQASGPSIQSVLQQNEYQAPRQANQIPQKPAQDPDDMKFLGPSDRRRAKKGIAVENTGGKVAKRDIFSGNDETENQHEFGAIKELGSVREKENLNQDKNNSNLFKNNNSQVKKSALDEDGEDESSGLDFLKKGKQKINYKDDDDDVFGAPAKKQTKETGFGQKKQDDKNSREKQMVQKAQQNDFFGDLM